MAEESVGQFSTCTLLHVFLEQLLKSPTPNLDKMETLFEETHFQQRVADQTDQAGFITVLCKEVGDVLGDNFDDIRNSADKYIFSLYVVGKLDTFQEDVNIGTDDPSRIGRRLKDKIPRLIISRYSQFQQLLSQTRPTVWKSIHAFLKRWAIVSAHEISKTDFSIYTEDKFSKGKLDIPREQQVIHEIAYQTALQFFSYACLYFTVNSLNTHQGGALPTPSWLWEPLLDSLKWSGPRDVFVSAFAAMLKNFQSMGLIPISGKVFLRITLYVMVEYGLGSQSLLDDLMKDIWVFSQNDYLNKEDLLQIGEELQPQNVRDRVVPRLRGQSREAEQVWIPLLAFFTTYFWDMQPNHMMEAVMKLVKQQTTFLDAATVYHRVVNRMQLLFKANGKPDHKSSLKALSSVVFAASSLGSLPASVSSDDILNSHKSLPDSQNFCQHVLLKCFGLAPCIRLTFATKFNQPHNRRICKQLAHLLDEAKEWGLGHELDNCLQAIFTLLGSQMKCNSKPSPNAAVFKFMSYSIKYIQTVKGNAEISFGFRVHGLSEAEFKVEAYLLQQVAEAMHAFRRCSNAVVRSSNCLPAVGWKRYCQFAAKELETGIPEHVSPHFIKQFLETTEQHSQANMVKATLYQEFFSALHKGYGDTVSIPSSQLLLSAMRSIQSEEREDLASEEPEWMGEFNKLLDDVENEVVGMYQLIKKDQFTAARLQTLLSKKDEMNALFRVFGMKIPVWKQERDFDNMKRKLKVNGSQLRILLIHPAHSSEVQYLVNELDKMLVCFQVTYERLRKLSDQADHLLTPLQAEQLDELDNDRVQTALNYLEYFEEQRSVVFEGFCEALVPLHTSFTSDLPGEWYSCIGKWLRDVHSAITKLLNRSMKLSELPCTAKFQELLSNQNKLTQELNHIGYYPCYQSDVDRTGPLCESLSTARLVRSIPQFVESLRILEVADEKDDDYLFIRDLASQSVHRLTLEEIRSNESYSKLCSLFGQLSGDCMDVLKDAGQYDAVVKFFRDHDFHSKGGMAEFEHIVENMTMRVRGNAFKSDLLSAVVVCRECLTPLRSPNSPLKDVIAAAELCSCNWRETTKFLQRVNGNMVQVQRMFSKEMMSTHDDVTEQACLLAESGLIDLPLEFSLKKTFPCQLKIGTDYDDRGDAKQEFVLLQGEDLRAFKLLLAFESSRPLPHEQQATLNMVVATLDEVQKVVNTAQQLADMAHPLQRQMKHIVCHFKLSEVTSLRERLEHARSQWNETLQQLRNDCSLLKLFQAVDVAHIMDLLLPRTNSSTVDPEPGKLTLNFRRFMSYVYSISSVIRKTERQERVQTVATIAATLSRAEVDEETCTEEMRKRLVAVMKPLDDVPIALQPDKNGNLFACCFSGETASSENVILFLLKALSSSHNLPMHFQTLWCSPSTSATEILSFFSMITSCSDLPFACVGVDNLSLDMRHELESQQRLLDNSHGDVYFIYLDVGAAPTLPSKVKSYNDLTVTSEEVYQMWRSLLLQLGVQRPTVTAVCGETSSGKTCFILKEIESVGWESVKLTMNESFESAQVIEQLNMLPDEAVIYISISSQVDPLVVNRFMFSLFICGILYDERMHSLFAFPQNSEWRVFVEVPFETQWQVPLDEIMAKRYPTVKLLTLGNHIEWMDKSKPYYIGDSELKLAHEIAYLSQWDSKIAPRRRGLLKRYRPDAAAVLREMKANVTIRNEDTAREILQDLVAARELDPTNKTIVRSFLRLLAKRFTVFSDEVVILNTAEKPSLPKRLYDQFVKEAAFLCQPHLSCLFKDCSQPLLNFSMDRCGVSFLALYRSDKLPQELEYIAEGGDKDLKDLSEIARLEAHLAGMLNVSPSFVHRLLQKRRFVLTEDICYKMILIHQRKCACVPVIIEGETGVGKTYLLETYSVLLNWTAYASPNFPGSLMLVSRVSNWLRTQLLPMVPATLNLPYHQLAYDLIHEAFDEEDLVKQWKSIADRLASDESIYRQAVDSMKEHIGDWYDSLPLLKPKSTSVSRLLTSETVLTVEESSELLRLFLNSPTYSLFYKMLVHPGLQPAHIQDFLASTIDLAQRVHQWEVVVLFDEVNTSSCLGVFKEIIVDHTFKGRSLPDNLFIVAAINPYRDPPFQPEASTTSASPFQRVDYNVAKLPDAMKNLFWKYGGFDIQHAEAYIRAKIKLEKDILATQESKNEKDGISAMLISSELQEKFTNMLVTAVRFCYERLGKNTVSQRDIQRVFTLLPFMYHHGLAGSESAIATDDEPFYEAVCLTIAVAFLWKLPVESEGGESLSRREMFGPNYFENSQIDDIAQKHVNAFVTHEHFEFPDGVALTQALRENVFAVVACIQTGVPMAIVGAPGLSKTLSFLIVRNNLKGPKYSPKAFCRQFDAVDPFNHHCSEFSEAGHIELTFHKAIQRQEEYDTATGTHKTRCVVFLDDGGLPDEKMMILKSLHPFLDEPKVSFVAASNRAFDAANSNRMMTIYRSHLTKKDLYRLAVACLGLDGVDLDSSSEGMIEAICCGLSKIVLSSNSETWNKTFHYRDFIHYFRCVHRCHHLTNQPMHVKSRLHIDPLLLLKSLEENMNGLTRDEFDRIVTTFFTTIVTEAPSLALSEPFSNRRNTVAIVEDLLKERLSNRETIWTGHLLAPRFTMIIDPTNDLSALQLLFHYDLLSRDNCKVFHISDFSDDRTELQIIQKLIALCFALEEETIAVFVNCKRLEGSLYELLNQNFRGSRHSLRREAAYANIAIGSSIYPCKVNPLFYCIVIVAEEDLPITPAPFLSRFAKFRLSPKDFLQWRLQTLPVPVASSVDRWSKYANDFIEHYGRESLVGLSVAGTVDLILLSGLDWNSFYSSSEQARFQVTSYHTRHTIQDHVTDDDQRSKAAVVSRLLQLATPESMVLNLDSTEPSFKRLMVDLYCSSPQHFELSWLVSRLLSHADSPLEHDFGESNDWCSTRKLLLYARSTRDLDNLSCNVSELFGKQNPVSPSVASGLNSQNAVADFLERFLCDSVNMVAVLGVDMMSKIDVSLLCQMIDDADRIARSVSSSASRLIGDRLIKRPVTPSNRIFVLLLHFPGERIFNPEVVSARFLDGWDTFFVEQTDILGSRVLRGLTEVCAQTTEEMPSAVSSGHYTVKLKDVFLQDDVWNCLLEDCIQWFCSRVRMVVFDEPVVSKRLSPSVQKFYLPPDCSDPTQEKKSALREVLARHPVIEDFIQDQLIEKFKVDSMSRLLLDSARQVFCKKSPFTLCDLLMGHLKQIARELVSSVFICLCGHFGLSTLMQLPELEQSRSLLGNVLHLMPRMNRAMGNLRRVETIEYVLQIQPIVYKTPLFPQIRSLYQDALSDCSIEDDVDRLTLPQTEDDYIDKLAQLAPQIGQWYIEDVVLHVCGGGVMSEGCESCSKVVKWWLRLGQEQQDLNDISLVETGVKHHCSEMTLIYKAAMLIRQLSREDDLASVTSATSRRSLADMLNARLCEILVSDLQRAGEDSASFEHWLVSFWRYFHSRIAQHLPGENHNWLFKFYTLTACYALAMSTSSVASMKSSVSRLLLLCQQIVRSSGIIAVIQNVAILVFSNSLEDCNRSVLYVHMLKWLTDSIPAHKSMTKEILQDVKDLLRSLNGRGIPPQITLQQFHCNSVFGSLREHVDMDQRSWKLLLEEVLQETCLNDCRGCHRVTNYSPPGYPERERSPTCLQKPLADAYFFSLLETECNFIKRASFDDDTPSVAFPLTDSIQQAAIRRRHLLELAETLQSGNEHGDMLEGRESMRQLVVSVWDNQTVSSHLTGDQMTFLDCILTAGEAAKTNALFAASSNHHLNKMIGPRLAKGVRFDRATSQYMPTVDDNLVIEEPLEMFPDIRNLLRNIEAVFHTCNRGTLYQRLSDQSSESLAQPKHQPVQRECRQTLKMLILLQSYRILRSGEINQPLDAMRIEDATSLLHWSLAEQRVLSFLLCPRRQLDRVPQSSVFLHTFSYVTGSSDVQQLIRHICFNHLLLTVGLGEGEDGSYFWSLMFDPSSIVGKHVFGGTTNQANNPITDKVKLDCCYEDHSEPPSLSKCLSSEATQVLSFLTFTSLLWYITLHASQLGADECCLSILTRDKVNEITGKTMSEKIATFCWLKSLEVFQNLCKGDGCSPTRIALVIQHVMSRFAAQHRQPNRSPFQQSYRSRNKTIEAEKAFQKKVFTPVWNSIETIYTLDGQDEGEIMQQLDEYRRKRAVSVTYRDFNKALVNAGLTVPDDNPLRTFMQELPTLTQNSKFVPICRLYLLIHHNVDRWSTCLDQSLDAFVETVAHHETPTKGQELVGIMEEGISAFNSLLAALGGIFNINEQPSVEEISEKTPLRIVYSVTEANTSNALFQAMKKLTGAHHTVLTAFKAYGTYCQDKAVKALLSMRKLEEKHEINLEQVVACRDHSLITVKESEFNVLLSTCLKVDGQEGFLHSFDFSKVERLVIQRYIVPAQCIDLKESKVRATRKPLVEHGTHHPSRTPSPKLPPFLSLQPLSTEFQTSLDVNAKRDLLREIADKRQDECTELLENLSLLVATLSTVLALEGQITSVTPVVEMSLAQFAATHKLDVSSLLHCPLLAATKMKHLESLHVLVKEHLVESGCSHLQLGPLLKEPLPPDVQCSINTALSRLSVSDSPQTMVDQCDQFRSLVQDNFNEIRDKLDSSLVSVLLSVSNRNILANNLILHHYIPRNVLVKHVSALLTLILRAAATTRQQIIEDKRRVMWGFGSGKSHGTTTSDHTWRKICLPNDQSSDLLDLVLKHASGLWKSAECRRSSMLTFNIEILTINEILDPMEPLVSLDSISRTKRHIYHICDGKRKGKEKLASRTTLSAELRDEKLTNKHGLVLDESEQPAVDGKRVTVFRYMNSETCQVCVQVRGPHVRNSGHSRTRVELTRDGAVFTAQFAKESTVEDVLRAVLALCLDKHDSEPSTAVILLRDGRVVDNHTRLEDLASSLQHLHCLTSVRSLFKCSRFSSPDIADCCLVPSQTRDFISHALQLTYEQVTNCHSFYLWPPVDDKTLCDTTREVFVVPFEWLCVTIVTADCGSTEESSCQLPALLTTSMKTAGTYASKKFGVPFNAQAFIDAKGLDIPVASLVSVGCVRQRCLDQSKLRIRLVQLPLEWRVQVVEYSKRSEQSVKVSSGSSVTQLVRQLIRSLERAEQTPLEADPPEQVQLVDAKSHCILPRLLRLPFCFVSDVGFPPRPLVLMRQLSARQRMMLKVEMIRLDAANASTCVKTEKYEFCVLRDDTILNPAVRAEDFLDFLSWLPELSEAFSARNPPRISFANWPAWLQANVALADYIHTVTGKELGLQIAFCNSYSLELPSIAKFCYNGKELCCTPHTLAVTVGDLRQMALEYFSLSDNQFLLTVRGDESCSLVNSWSWKEVECRCPPDSNGTIAFTFVDRISPLSVKPTPRKPTKVLIKGSDKTLSCDVHLADNSTVEEIIQLSLSALSLEDEVHPSTCSLYFGNLDVRERDVTLNELQEARDEDEEQSQLLVELPDSHRLSHTN
jgi:hypothetical protein